MIKINQLNYYYHKQHVLNNINLDIDNGDFIAIIGANGSGKSTLIRCILGMQKVGCKMIEIDGVCINKFKNFKKIGYVQQIKHSNHEIPITSYEYLKLISNDKNRIDKVIKDLKLEEFLKTNVNKLSGGQRQRLNIAKAILHDIDYLILDEPNTGLDFESRQGLYKLLAELNEKKITIIIVSHHLNEISCKINKIFNLEDNSIKEVSDDSCEYC